MKSTISKYNILFAVASFILAITFISTFINQNYQYNDIIQLIAMNCQNISSSVIFFAIGICCLLGGNENVRKIIFSVFLFMSSALYLICLMPPYTVSVYTVLVIVLFAALGILTLIGKKKTKTASCILVISVMAADVIFTFISSSIYRAYYSYLNSLNLNSEDYLLSTQEFHKLMNTFGFGSGHNFIFYLTLFCILAYFIITGIETERKIKTENGSEISLNGDVLDFKTLLSFVENQYRTGEIGEEEYKNKRAEILKNL